jgi:hypothetical protein
VVGLTNNFVIAYVVQWVVIIGLIFFMYSLLKLVGINIRRIEKLENTLNGTKKINKEFIEPEYSLTSVPAFTEISVTTREKIDLKMNAEKILFIFVSPSCTGCKDFIANFLPGLRFKKPYKLVVISSEANKKDLDYYKKELHKMDIPLVISNKIIKAYQIPYYPYMVAIDSEMKVLKSGGLFKNLDYIEKVTQEGQIKSS